MFKQSIAMAILVAGLTACSGGGKSSASVEMYGGDYIFSSKEKNKEKIVLKSIKPAADIAQLVIEGKTVEMWRKAYAVVEMEEQPITKNISSVGYEAGDLGWGAVRGKLTSLTEMPKVGVATYKGDTKYFYSSTFKVDFGKKTVNGELQHKKDKVKLPTSRIEGNAFHYADAKQEVRGHFFGKNAAELGGIWMNTEKLRRIIPFAATKQ